MAESKGKGDKEPERQKTVFVITPIGVAGSPERLHADWVLNQAVKPVFEPRGYEVFRSDTIADPAMINDAIFNHITDDDVCIADLSFLNPNVFYELGVRHALRKPVIHIAHDAIRLPFDTAQHRAIFFTLSDYHSVESLKRQMGGQLDAIEADGFKVSNPLTHAKGRQDLANSGDSKDQLVSDLLSRVQQLEQLEQGRPRLRGSVFVGGNYNRVGVRRGSLADPSGLQELEMQADALARIFVDNAVKDNGNIDKLRSKISDTFGSSIFELNRSERLKLFDYLSLTHLNEPEISIIIDVLSGL